jgi:hypothetical protein
MDPPSKELLMLQFRPGLYGIFAAVDALGFRDYDGIALTRRGRARRDRMLAGLPAFSS